MRIMGLDFGAATMGVAISDELLITAQPIEIIRREKENQLRHTYQRLEELIKEYDVQEIVLGYPKMLNDTIGEKAQACEKVKDDLERRTGLKVTLVDERLTTVQAHRILDEAEMSYKKKAAVIDKMAASIILQTYLDSREK
ncbi:MAG: Holliday junction resolvase RuvX [Lachnospiraceae bacterium]|nr:Holliday junction resolvase RuvX [Lachnospiraceae bacterium]